MARINFYRPITCALYILCLCTRRRFYTGLRVMKNPHYASDIADDVVKRCVTARAAFYAYMLMLGDDDDA